MNSCVVGIASHSILDERAVVRKAVDDHEEGSYEYRIYIL